MASISLNFIYSTVQYTKKMSFQKQVKKLTADHISEIEVHYYAALETEHGSGEHWILMTVLDRYGFRTNSPTQAMEVADKIIVMWYTLNK